ncbi:hypothetical protein QTP86_006780 [Hemibagrus guttatus]|nr:hypothetical protein QTP86_006780 [Hemibagrus guttatus]
MERGGKEVKKRVQAGWNGWRKVSGVLCDRKISARIKGKVYRTVVRPAMLYGLETVSLRKRQESELEVAELKMLRLSLGVTRLDRIRNKYIRGTAHVGRLGDKVREARLRWFGHVQRREIMDPAGHRSMQTFLDSLSQILVSHEQRLQDLTTATNKLISRISQLPATVSPITPVPPMPPSSAPTPTPLHEPHLPHPERFAGEPGFLHSLQIPAILISLLPSKAKLWPILEWERQSAIYSSDSEFLDVELACQLHIETFDHPGLAALLGCPVSPKTHHAWFSMALQTQPSTSTGPMAKFWTGEPTAKPTASPVYPQQPSSVADKASSDIISVPSVYNDLGVGKVKASSLPLHRSYDCAIYLLPGTTPPWGHLYHLTGQEREVMTT